MNKPETQSGGSLKPVGWAPAIRFAAREVAKLGAHFVTNRQAGDVAMYEQGIGCERASKMLEEIARLIESQQQPNDTDEP
jgi:hypothetical protein